MEQYKVDFGSMPWEEPAAGCRFKACARGGTTLRLAEFTKEFVDADWCARGHIGYILEGRMEIDFDGKVTVLGEGDGLFIPAGKEHRHMARVVCEPVRMVLMEDA
jgi:hypothetical protein